jgi:hypothetical protein
MNTLLQDVCNTVKTQGGTLAGYDKEFIVLHSAFGQWHKHCPKGKVLFIGNSLYSEMMDKNYPELFELKQEGFMVDDETYNISRDKNTKRLFLIPKEKCVKFSKELILNDRY